ncbi:MAG: flagellar hook-length control protein FliK [Desulfobacterales bacterium]|nr:flagellar hook-length control protein FliK [Desulfobacterales bacterium]
MSSDAFILPGLPQIPAAGLNGTAAKGPAAFKSNQLKEPSDPSKSFSATLNRISDRRYGSKPEATPAEKPAVTSRGSNTDSASTQKMSKTTDLSHDHIEENQAPGSKEIPTAIYPLQAFGLMPSHLMYAAIAEDGSLAVEPPSGLTTESGWFRLTDLIGHLHPQRQQVDGEQLGIGPFEQLQANISPNATNRAFFESWQWMFPSASTAQEGTLNAQPESSGINGNAPLNPLLQILGMGTTGAAWNINPDTGSSQGPKMAAGQEGAHLDGALLDRLTALFQSAQTSVSENAKIAAAGHDGSLSSWATGDSNSETLLEAQARQMSENSQPLKIQETLKAAAEHPANPNSATEGITVKTPEEVFGIKSAVQKSEMLPVHALGNKISQIDGDSKDNGFLFSQDQMPQHLARLENGAHSSEATQRSLMSQTLNQIVQRAVLSHHNGQHQVQLHLKPDFLGHIQMQIVSEGQQVAIKMVAEFPFVRDMLENNLHQLKANLQAQGLDIDELEVSVAHDSHAEGDLHQKAEAAKFQAAKSGTGSDGESSEEPGQTQSRDGNPMAETAIDYFA